MMNRDADPCDKQISAPCFRSQGTCKAEATVSQAEAGTFFQSLETRAEQVDPDCLEVRTTLPPCSVCSIVIRDVMRTTCIDSRVEARATASGAQRPKLTAIKMVEFAQRAAEATVSDIRTRGAWARCQHCRASVNPI